MELRQGKSLSTSRRTARVVRMFWTTAVHGPDDFLCRGREQGDGIVNPCQRLFPVVEVRKIDTRIAAAIVVVLCAVTRIARSAGKVLIEARHERGFVKDTSHSSVSCPIASALVLLIIVMDLLKRLTHDEESVIVDIWVGQPYFKLNAIVRGIGLRCRDTTERYLVR